MSKDTKIQWCHHTYNPWRGCRKVAPECANCYITSTPPFRISGQTHGSVRVRAGAGALGEPLKWNAAAEKAGERHSVFCLSLGDWLDNENVPIEWFVNLLEVIHATPHLDWLLLTKRPQNWQQRTSDAFDFAMKHGEDHGRQMDFTDWLGAWTHAHIAPANVWIGVSAGADQAAALAIPARVHFLSCEPMLHEMDATHAADFDWIIFGGESGPNARFCATQWIRKGVEFCAANGIAAFVKQLGANCGFSLIDKKGGEPKEWPADLRVRGFPSANAGMSHSAGSSV